MTDPRLGAAKITLRLDARARRKVLMIEHPEADWMAADHIPAMLTATRRTRPGVIGLYKALGAELDPRPLGETLRKAGWSLALPAVVAEAAPLAFRAARFSDGSLATERDGVVVAVYSAAETDAIQKLLGVRG